MNDEKDGRARSAASRQTARNQKQDRKARLAEQLRANLTRRKAQQRLRREKDMDAD